MERYRLDGRFVDTVKGLHKLTKYRVKGREGLSEEWRLARGLREGCVTSPVLFNMYHHAVMRKAEAERMRRGGDEVGIGWRWMSGSSFAGVREGEFRGKEGKNNWCPLCRWHYLGTTLCGKDEEGDGQMGGE